ncbi:MAG: hypothetical protein ACQESK_04685 [Bacteroidota bacterium]
MTFKKATLILMILVSFCGRSQSDTGEDETNKGIMKSLSFEFSRDYRGLDFNHLNSRLAELDLPSSFSNDVAVNYIGLEWNFAFWDNRPTFGLSVSNAQKESMYQSVENESELSSLRAHFGYKVINDDAIQLSFRAGLVIDRLSLNLHDTADSSSDFNDGLMIPANRNLSTEVVSVDFSPKFTYYIFKNLGIFGSAGYQIQLNSTDWKSNSSNLSNAPKMSFNNFFARLGLTYRFVNL